MTELNHHDDTPRSSRRGPRRWASISMLAAGLVLVGSAVATSGANAQERELDPGCPPGTDHSWTFYAPGAPVWNYTLITHPDWVIVGGVFHLADGRVFTVEAPGGTFVDIHGTWGVGATHIANCKNPPPGATTTTAPPVETTTTAPPGAPTTTTPPVEETTTTAPPVEETTTTAPPVEETTTTAPPVEETTTTAPPVEETTTTVGPEIGGPTTTVVATTLPSGTGSGGGTVPSVELPRTGGGTTLTLLLGAALIGFGGLLAFLGRRPKTIG